MKLLWCPRHLCICKALQRYTYAAHISLISNKPQSCIVKPRQKCKNEQNNLKNEVVTPSRALYPARSAHKFWRPQQFSSSWCTAERMAWLITLVALLQEAVAGHSTINHAITLGIWNHTSMIPNLPISCNGSKIKLDSKLDTNKGCLARRGLWWVWCLTKKIGKATSWDSDILQDGKVVPKEQIAITFTWGFSTTAESAEGESWRILCVSAICKFAVLICCMRKCCTLPFLLLEDATLSENCPTTEV